jgi:predicted GIY-YIG superfamily endonuclease
MMTKFTYVYIIQSKQNPKHHYTGITDDLEERLKKHNEGGCPHTAKFKPWEIRTAIAFKDRKRAAEFEQYLKTHSGRVFSSRHF